MSCRMSWNCKNSVDFETPSNGSSNGTRFVFKYLPSVSLCAIKRSAAGLLVVCAGGLI
jgi:hypothetical protein